MSQSYDGVLADTLAMVNVIRGAFGQDMLDELPSAQPGNSSNCVFARALADVGATGVGGTGNVRFRDDLVAAKVAVLTGGVQEDDRTVQLPPQFAAVIGEFDRANLPELGTKQ